MNLSEEQVLALAPDEASRKSGKDLANPSKWVTKSDHGNAQFLSDLGVPVFACTPDKFPDLMAAALSKQDIGMWVAKEEMVLKK